MTKNIGKSIKTRLLNLAKEEVVTPPLSNGPFRRPTTPISPPHYAHFAASLRPRGAPYKKSIVFTPVPPLPSRPFP